MLVRKIMENCGYVCYQSVTNEAHLIDFLALYEKEFKFGVEVKTKPKFKNYPATGFDYRHYVQYQKFTEQQKLPLLILFVDEFLGKIYGNFLHVLDEPRYFHKMKYPGVFSKNGYKIRYYPMSIMLHIKDLSEKEIFTLKKFKE